MKIIPDSIPQGRALVYVVLLCLLPCLFAGLYTYNQLSYVDETDYAMDRLQSKAALYQKKQAGNQSVRSNFKDSDHFYIDKNLETLTFLEPEIDALQKITKLKNIPEDETLKKRLEFLTGHGNMLTFTEGASQKFGPISETIETLGHPVEVNVKDLNKILARLEGKKVGDAEPLPGRPQLLILEFKLDKKKSNDKNEVFLLNMKVLKREFS